MTTATPGISQDWYHTTAEIPPSGLAMSREATAEERRLLALQLDILGIDRLLFRYRISPAAGGSYRLDGVITADVVQACIVTLDPVRSTIEDHVDVEFRPDPAHEAAGRLGEELSILEATEFEPIEHNRLAIGRVVAETVTATLPPYPRAPGAELESNEAGPTAPGATSPFAALSDWKPRKDE